MWIEKYLREINFSIFFLIWSFFLQSGILWVTKPKTLFWPQLINLFCHKTIFVTLPHKNHNFSLTSNIIEMDIEYISLQNTQQNLNIFLIFTMQFFVYRFAVNIFSLWILLLRVTKQSPQPSLGMPQLVGIQSIPPL